MDTPNGIPRRTLVKGVAWSIPVIATVSAVPLASASPVANRILTFTSSMYTPNSDCEITGVTLRLTQDGAPLAGQPVTLTLPGDWTVNGSGSYSGVTDADGNVVVPAIKINTTRGESLTLVGRSAGAPDASVLASAPSTPVAGEYSFHNDRSAIYGPVPAGSKALGGGFYQDTAGNIYSGIMDGAMIVAEADQGAVGFVGTGFHYWVEYFKGGVAYEVRSGGGTPTSFPSVPSDAKPVSCGYFLQESTGNLYAWDIATPIATGVKTAHGYAQSGTYYVDYVDAQGAKMYRHSDAVTDFYPGIPQNVKALGNGFYLTPDGTLYSWEGGGTLIATNVTSASSFESAYDHGYLVDFVSNGSAFYYRSSQGVTPYSPLLPTDIEAIGGGFFLTGDKRLLTGKDGKVLASSITSAGGYAGDHDYWVNYVVTPACP
ncbi:MULTISPECIES: hypothetical protein [Bacteria]|uniref:hypothetical protein n=1 Tax=Bacteria TaxID=2 RepID=UPI003C7E416F